ncbi:phytanoyl-CoA dioxygenase [Fragilaria crotonensis]|nr:phytanoyl-CoA dioxygenase [Fragilaria crotonensis]
MMSFILYVIQAIVAVLNYHGVGKSRSGKRDAAVRVLRLSLSSPDANITDIFNDAKVLFSDELNEEEILSIMHGSCSENSGTDTPSKHDSSDEAPLPSLDLPEYADRHLKRFDAITNDYDCMEREFDFQDPSFDITEASLVLSKCRLLVVRNFFPQELIHEYRTNFTNFLNRLHTGYFDNVNGKTTLGETGLSMPRGAKRYEVLLPKYLRNNDVIANGKLLKVLTHKQVLGENMVASVVGGVIVEAGASVGYWHDDAPFLYENDAFEQYHISGHDFPPTAVTLFFPLFNMTRDHGPTQFCLGTSYYQGLGPSPNVLDESLIDRDTPFAKMASFMKSFNASDVACPDGLMRDPILKLGDVVLFDYTIVHRGGANTSPDLRAMQYVTYSRPWFHEPNWLPKAQGMSKVEELTRSTRFALVDEPIDSEDDCLEAVRLEDIQNFLKPNAAGDIRTRSADI